MKKQRKHYTPEEKVAILRRHLLEQVPISELCDKQGLQPAVFYRWQKEFFENGAAAFQPKARPNHSAGHERDGVHSAHGRKFRAVRPGPRLTPVHFDLPFNTGWSPPPTTCRSSSQNRRHTCPSCCSC